ncbi:cytochrome c oxidase mono-heme FixO family subunit [Roseimicrobium gellanilyticum]|uniref:Cytochrome c oxidase mono-heme FixO family subunit n=1 Tax=Roseimicrobium gellanilyticum TaxID=748857 RepID=A0A366HW35_9BACT|nr:cbb3-type cytochrome c oxidase subunit II [Roseimicrobium gellanilyticum]RBP47498.1 cytochrome c oxidase mono-heme FixO family subunit [Roseimicrobium gellanilyticum]
MTGSRKFLFGLAGAFGVPWLLLVIIPVIKAQKLTPEAYDKDRDGIEGVYPSTSIDRQGQLVYISEGCAQCHTQMIRPSFVGILDGWKKGWGSDQSDQPKHAVRPSKWEDYMGEPVAPLGIQRNGPDLANYGYRAPKERAAIHLKLYAPRASKTNAWSMMPSYRHLYKVKAIEGNGSSHALEFPEDMAKELKPKKGFEVVPTPAAEQLVDYLLSLKKDAPVPGEVVAEDAK